MERLVLDKRWFRCFALALVIAGLMTVCPAAHANTLLGPVQPYTSFAASSPFASESWTYFHLETFESGGITVPGVTAAGGGVIGPGSLVDSVEGITAGHSYFSECGSCPLTFTFSAAALGGNLPTSAGIVWTDGYIPITFQAYDEHGNLIGTINDSNPGDFSSGDGNPAHFRFYGAYNAGGISYISIYSNGAGGIEVDDLQYGLNGPAAVPEPGSVALFATGLAALSGAVRRRRAR